MPPGRTGYAQQRRANTIAGHPHDLPQVVEDLKSEGPPPWAVEPLPARRERLVRDRVRALAELTGWSPDLAPAALNCAAPDTGNMEVLHLVGTDEQKRR